MMDFLVMGGYAFYVWGAYGVTALAIVAEIVSLRARRRAALDEAQVTATAEAAR
jgi:heme exporter protein D